MTSRIIALLIVALALSGCSRVPALDRSQEPAATPTFFVDSTRSEGPPITFDELTRGISDRWYLLPGVDSSEMPDEWRFYPDGVWTTPSFQGYSGVYEFPDHRTLRMTYLGSGLTINFGFTLVGDELTLYLDDKKWPFRRVPTPAPRTPAQPASGTPGAVTPTPTGTLESSNEATPEAPTAP